MKTQAGFLWECICGHQEYGEHAPDECPHCHHIDSFVQMPEEIVEDREKDLSDLIIDEGDTGAFSQRKKSSKRSKRK